MQRRLAFNVTSLRADKELRRENAVVVLLRYVCASDVYVRALLEDSFWSG